MPHKQEKVFFFSIKILPKNIAISCFNTLGEVIVCTLGHCNPQMPLGLPCNQYAWDMPNVNPSYTWIQEYATKRLCREGYRNLLYVQELISTLMQMSNEPNFKFGTNLGMC